MAIIEDLGLEVEILVDNSPLREYEDEEEDFTDDGFGNEIAKCRRYVEVVEDAEFGVQCRVRQPDYYLTNENERLLFTMDLDGKEDLENCLLVSETQELIEGKFEYGGQALALRKFKFTTVATVDDDDRERVHKDEKTARGLGLIRVRVFRVEATKRYPPGVRGQTPEIDDRFDEALEEDDEMENQMAEKALKGKALSHRATLSAPVATDDFMMTDFKYVDPVDVPLAVFYFKYRSKAALQDEMIIPRSREASHQQGPVENLSLQEGEHSAPLRPAVKREQTEIHISERPQKTVKISGGREAIDLTDDD